MEVKIETALATIRERDAQIAEFEEQLVAIRSQDEAAHASEIDVRIRQAEHE